ncbi:MAG: diguanylate cyclase [Curvibacter sp.]|nr:diguanylate cyclase [Curvibacter sp.]
MLKDPSRFRSIATTLIQRIVALAFVCLLVMSGVQGFLEYQQTQQRADVAVQDIADNSLPMLSLSLWDIEPESIQRQVNWLASLPEIGHVRVQASTGQWFEAGDPERAKTSPDRRMPINAPQGGKAVGELDLWLNPGYLLMNTLIRTINMVAGYVLFTAILCLAVAWMLKRQLQQPLQQIARFAVELKPQELSKPLLLTRPERRHVDEIDLVTDGFRQLQGDLRSHIGNLDNMVAERTQQLEKLIEEVHRLSITDALTGCFNRRVIEERLPSEIERARRYGRPLSVIFTDIDLFKQINDERGHAAGDVVLREVASRLLAQLRTQVDWVARYGGEEFLIVLPESDLEMASRAAERLRETIEGQPVLSEGITLHITASFGVAQCAPDEGMADLLSRADAMLYHAKAEGRNRVMVSG